MFSRTIRYFWKYSNNTRPVQSRFIVNSASRGFFQVKYPIKWAMKLILNSKFNTVVGVSLFEGFKLFYLSYRGHYCHLLRLVGAIGFKAFVSVVCTTKSDLAYRKPSGLVYIYIL